MFPQEPHVSSRVLLSQEFRCPDFQEEGSKELRSLGVFQDFRRFCGFNEFRRPTSFLDFRSLLGFKEFRKLRGFQDFRIFGGFKELIRPLGGQDFKRSGGFQELMDPGAWKSGISWLRGPGAVAQEWEGRKTGSTSSTILDKY